VAFSVVILAGGRSMRMGVGADKANLRLDGRTLLARTVDVVSELSDDVQIVGREGLPADCPPVRRTADVVAGAGPLGGLHAGLAGARHDRVLGVACDYPFLSAAVVRLLVERSAGHDAAVPRLESTLHVTQAVYSRALLPQIEARMRAARYRLRDLLDGCNVCIVDEAELRAVDPDLRSLLNVNTPQDWQRAVALAVRRKQ
jgi:molybdopterin-guanine dinucleotide biosynthesis protein A